MSIFLVCSKIRELNLFIHGHHTFQTFTFFPTQMDELQKRDSVEVNDEQVNAVLNFISSSQQ
jgi:hypothetical protein